jgi:hypothetical protein
MTQAGRWLFNFAAGVSLIVSIGIVALWLRTEYMSLHETFDWSEPGIYRALEFSSDDAEFKILKDPGITSVPLRRHTTNGGWVRPPGPSNPGAVPAWSSTVLLPQPRSSFYEWETRSIWGDRFGFDYCEFDGWYGPGTIVYSYRVSYFVGLIPAATVCLAWLGVFGWRRHRQRHRPGFCPTCGYDLRATPDRCPECGTIPSAAKGSAA